MVSLRNALVFLCAGVALAASPFPYDHQTATYVADHRPVTSEGELSITPVFSPEWSSLSLTSLIESATSTVDITTPGFSSWSGCTPYETSGCVKACSPEDQSNEKFPIFQAILNALHAGIKVRIVTNNYETPDCKGTISALNFLVLNGASVHYYASTTFVHAKYISVDGNRTAVSSINFSRTSFTRNREAGGILEGKAAAPLISYMQSIFEFDYSHGTPMKADRSAFSDSELAVILNSTTREVIMPKPSPTWADYYNPPAPAPITGSAKVTVSASPDYSAYRLEEFLEKAKESVDIMIYQITDDSIATTLLRLWERGVKVNLLVSSSVFSAFDCKAANAVYQRLYNMTHKNPIPILKTSRHYAFSHQKFFIIDGGKSFGWSTGNMSPTDYPNQTDTSKAFSFPPYGNAGWVKTNRDFTVYVEGNTAMAAPFQAVMHGDRDTNGTFPSPVYAWTPKHQVACGSG